MPLDPKQQPPYYTPGNSTPSIIPYNIAGLSLTQVGTNPPTVLELFNELNTGTITPSYIGTATYKLTLANSVLTTSKTLILVSAIDTSTQGVIKAFSNAQNEITIITKILRSDTTDPVLWEDSNDILLGTQLLIIVYP